MDNYHNHNCGYQYLTNGKPLWTSHMADYDESLYYKGGGNFISLPFFDQVQRNLPPVGGAKGQALADGDSESRPVGQAAGRSEGELQLCRSQLRGHEPRRGPPIAHLIQTKVNFEFGSATPTLKSIFFNSWEFTRAHLNRDQIETNLCVPGIQGCHKNALYK